MNNKRLFTLGEKVWDSKFREWCHVVCINGDITARQSVLLPNERLVLQPIPQNPEREIRNKNHSARAVDVYQLAEGYTFKGAPVCWEHAELTKDQYEFFCPDRDENCFRFELEEIKKHRFKVVGVNRQDKNDEKVVHVMSYNNDDAKEMASILPGWQDYKIVTAINLGPMPTFEVKLLSTAWPDEHRTETVEAPSEEVARLLAEDGPWKATEITRIS